MFQFECRAAAWRGSGWGKPTPYVPNKDSASTLALWKKSFSFQTERSAERLEKEKLGVGRRPTLSDQKFQMLENGDPGWVFARLTFVTDDGDEDLKESININHFPTIRKIPGSETRRLHGL